MRKTGLMLTESCHDLVADRKARRESGRFDAEQVDEVRDAVGGCVLDHEVAAGLAGADELGAHADFLMDGALVVTLPQTGSATDQAAMAARVALMIKDRWPEATVAVSTGRGVAHGMTAVGDVALAPAKSVSLLLRLLASSASFERVVWAVKFTRHDPDALHQTLSLLRTPPNYRLRALHLPSQGNESAHPERLRSC